METENIGKRFGKVLPKKGTMVTTNFMAVKRVFTFKITERIRILKISELVAAQSIHISKSTLNTFLNSDDESVTLSTMMKVANWLGSRLRIDIVQDDVSNEEIQYNHPGEILLHEFLLPLNISQARLSREIGVPARRISEIVHGKKTISPEVGNRLSIFFGLSKGFWDNLLIHN